MSNKTNRITVIILTYNESIHIERAINSVRNLSPRLYVVDSGSTDQTTKLASNAGATILVNRFVNQATQFNWALTQLPADTDWILRLDADEVASEELIENLGNQLASLPNEIKGIQIKRSMHFMNKKIKWGGVFPIKIVRLVRFGYGEYEQRWMDEHLNVNGAITEIEGEVIDINLNLLSWWIDKHNDYSNREVIQMLIREYGSTEVLIIDKQIGGYSEKKRWIKENLYLRLPIGIRAFLFFLYRYIFRLGFVDGKEGFAFHFLQGFWYRYLVDIKYLQTIRVIKSKKITHIEAIKEIYGINIE